jgi:hypothetical protein
LLIEDRNLGVAEAIKPPTWEDVRAAYLAAFGKQTLPEQPPTRGGWGIKLSIRQH